MRIPFAAVVLGAILAASAACGSSEPIATPTPEPTSTATPTPTATPEPTATPTPAATVVEGSFWLLDDVLTSECIGHGGYSDISPSTEVRLVSGEGTLLDVTRLGARSDPTYSEGVGCVYWFELAVPPGHDFYTVELGNRDRGSFSYRYEELLEEDPLSYSLGD